MNYTIKAHPVLYLIDDDGHSAAFTEKLYDVLRKVDEQGSIRAASDVLPLSNSYARRLIRDFEESYGEKLTRNTWGGQHGCKSELTAEGVRLVGMYDKAKRNLDLKAMKEEA